jgi:hypothetical protein
MFTRTRKLIRRRRFLTGLVLGFATLGVFAGAAPATPQSYDQSRYGASHNVPASEPRTYGGGVSKALFEQHMLREQREAERAAGVRTPDYSHLPAEDRASLVTPEPTAPRTETAGASSSGSGFDGADWMRGVALAVALIAASAFAVLMVRGGVRTAHS